MCPVIPTEIAEDTRCLIIDAAQERYRNYGYGKTTMAEIAEDVDMSAANLYRYFKNKHEIGTACAQRCMLEKIEELQQIAKKPGLTAAQRLRAYVLRGLEYTLENVGTENKLNELVQIVLEKSPDLVHKKVEKEVSQIVEILAQGNSEGEFQVEDLIATAKSIQTALIGFNVPIFMSLYPEEQFYEMANGVVDLILKGINKH